MSVGRQALRLVEAAYSLQRDGHEWLCGLLEAARPLIDRGHGSFAVAFRISRTDGSVDVLNRCHSAELSTPLVDKAVAFGSHADRDTVRRVHVDDVPIETASSLWCRAGSPPNANPLTAIESMGFVDSIGAKSFDPSGVGVNLCSMLEARDTVPAVEVERWRLLRSHVLAGLRLRSALDEEAVLEPNGKVLHAVAEAKTGTALDALRRRAIAIERARTGPGRRDPDDALGAWQALVEGRWSLVDRFDSDGRRYLIARRNDPSVPGPRPLSRRERQIIAYAAMGYANKHIAYALGLAPSTVSSHLRRAMLLVGARTRADLARIWAHGTAVPSPD